MRPPLESPWVISRESRKLLRLLALVIGHLGDNAKAQATTTRIVHRDVLLVQHQIGAMDDAIGVAVTGHRVVVWGAVDTAIGYVKIVSALTVAMFVLF